MQTSSERLPWLRPFVFRFSRHERSGEPLDPLVARLLPVPWNILMIVALQILTVDLEQARESCLHQ
jgi:hypothetical protein